MSSYYTANTINASQPIVIDLRSDTVTRPTSAMKQAMMQCQTGDDVYDEDPTVNALQQRLAELLHKEAALFFASGTQSNLAAALSHCNRGEALITGNQYHMFMHEAHGASVLGGIALQPVVTEEYGKLSFEHMLAAIKPDDIHTPISRLISLENTVSGCVQDQQHINKLAHAAHDAGLKVHLDGARLFNAAIKQQKPIHELVKPIDSISICLSKGLGTPAGSVLVGDHDFIRRAKRNRKLLGGGMRQVGILAAAGHYALDYHIERLAEDHQHAQYLAEQLANINELDVDSERVDTNMVFIKPKDGGHKALREALAEQGIAIAGDTGWIRLVLHLDINSNHIDFIIHSIKRFYHTSH